MPFNPKSLINLRKATRWGKGQSGNPGGRGLLQGMIREELEANDHEKLKKIMEALFQAAIGEEIVETTERVKVGRSRRIKKRRKINIKAIELLLNYGYGKPGRIIEKPNWENVEIRVFSGFEDRLENTGAGSAPPVNGLNTTGEPRNRLP